MWSCCVRLCVCVHILAHTLSISNPEAFIHYISYFILLSLSVLSQEADRAVENGERRIASWKAVGKDLCPSVPCHCLFIHLSASVLSLQLPPSHDLFLCTLAVVQRDKSSTQSSFLRKLFSYFHIMCCHCRTCNRQLISINRRL